MSENAQRNMLYMTFKSKNEPKLSVQTDNLTRKTSIQPMAHALINWFCIQISNILKIHTHGKDHRH